MKIWGTLNAVLFMLSSFSRCFFHRHTYKHTQNELKVLQRIQLRRHTIRFILQSNKLNAKPTQSQSSLNNDSPVYCNHVGFVFL